jgi:spore cortex formation protein SpoVR/YcgB (stage V sporulation)
MLQHTVVSGAQLHEADTRHVIQHLADLWGYDVSLAEVDASNALLKEYLVKPRSIAAVA